MRGYFACLIRVIRINEIIIVMLLVLLGFYLTIGDQIAKAGQIAGVHKCSNMPFWVAKSIFVNFFLIQKLKIQLFCYIFT